MKKATDILTGRADLDKKVARRLARELKRHPYSQPLRMMYAKALMKIGAKDFEDAVNKAAACAPDQRQFRALLTGKGSSAVEKEVSHVEKNQAAPTDSPGNALEPATGGWPGGRKRADQQAIIDRFLEMKPSISAPRDDIPQGELAPDSHAESDDLISETLAEVLVKQGKKERAIEIFKQLSLKFPEKSSYFAKKIESIQ